MPFLRGTRLPLLSGGLAVAAAADWWDPDSEGLSVWAAYAAKGAADLAASYTDLSGNGNNAGVGVAPDWDAVNGWKFDQVNDYLTTTFVPQNDQAQTMIIQFSVAGSSLYIPLVGVIGGAGGRRFSLWPSYGASYSRYTNGGNTTGATRYTSGNMAVAGDTGYRNGISDTGALAAWADAITDAVWIGAINNVGSPLFYADAAVYCQALALYDTALTAPQVLAIATAMAAL